MEKPPANKSTILRSILIAAAIGIGVGLLLGIGQAWLGLSFPASINGAVVGATVGFSFVLLNGRNSK